MIAARSHSKLTVVTGDSDCLPREQQLCDCCTGVTHDTPRSSTTGPRCRRSPTGSDAGRRSTPGISSALLGDPKFAPPGAAAHPRQQRLLDRAARRLGADPGHPDLLSGALRQRGIPAHRRGPALGDRAGGPGGLRALPGRGRLAALAFTLSSAPGSPENVSSRRARDNRACRGRARRHRCSRPPPTWPRGSAGRAAGAHHAGAGRSPRETRARGSPAPPTTSTSATRCCSSWNRRPTLKRRTSTTSPR